MQACDDLKVVGSDLSVPRESVELMGMNPGERAVVQRDRRRDRPSLASGRVV